MNNKKKTHIQGVASVFMLVLFFMLSVIAPQRATAVSPSEQPAPYSQYSEEIGQKIATRCQSIKGYLSSTARINDLASRQNKVRGWEYVLRNLRFIVGHYEDFNISPVELNQKIDSLSAQLEQFKVDFEAYDAEFQKLLKLNCADAPEQFWLQLQTVRSFRAGISRSSQTYKTNIIDTIKNEQQLGQ